MLNNNLMIILVLLLIVFLLKDNINNYIKTRLSENFEVRANDMLLNAENTKDNDVLNKFLIFDSVYSQFKKSNDDLGVQTNSLDLVKSADEFNSRINSLSDTSSDIYNKLNNSFGIINNTIDSAQKYYDDKKDYVTNRQKEITDKHISSINTTVGNNKDRIGALLTSQDNRMFIRDEVNKRAKELSSNEENISNIETLYKNFIQSYNTKLKDSTESNTILNQNSRRFKDFIEFKKLSLPREDLSEYNGVLVRTYAIMSEYTPNTNQAENLINEYIVPSINYAMMGTSQSYFANSKGVNQYLEFFGFIKVPSGVTTIDFNVLSTTGARLFFGPEIIIDEFKKDFKVNHYSRKIYVEPLSKIPYKLITYDSNTVANYILLRWKKNNLGSFEVVDSSNYYLPNLKYD